MKETSAEVLKRVLNESRFQRGRPSNTVQEDTDFEPGLHVIAQLRKEPIHEMNIVLFKNGWKGAIPTTIRDKALHVYENLKPQQKLLFQEHIEQSPENFMKTLHLNENELVLSDGPVDGSAIVSESSENAAFSSGKVAGRQLKGIGTNPHKANSKESIAWEEGYKTGRKEKDSMIHYFDKK